jgi:O-antigen ligase
MTALDAPAERPEHADPDVRADAGTTELPVQHDEPRSGRLLRHRPELPYAWPLWALLMLYPLWWLLGLGTFIFPLAAVPMAIYLVRRCRPIKVPPGFGIWMLFLAWFCASVIMLRMNPPGTVGDSGSMRWAAVGLRLSLYLSITVILLYAGNLTERQLPRATLVRWLSVMFVITVGGGFLGMLWPSFGFTSPVELVLPQQIRVNEYVQSLVHPNSAQIQEILADPAPRPAAPFGYTNVWGENLSITLIWFVIAWWVYGTGLRKVATVALIGLAMVPAIYSLNRGMWLGVIFSIVFIAVRLALRGRLWLVGGLAVGLTVAALVFMFSPLYSTVQERLANGHSNRVREFTTEKVVEVTRHSPIIGLGNTRDAAGSARSIAVGKTAECPECRNPALGMNGHIWLVLISQGFVGAGLYMLFFLYGILRYWRDVTPIGLGGILILVLSLTYNFYYDASVTSLAFFMLAYALLWRNDIEHARVARRVALRPRNRRRFIGRGTARTQGSA